MPEKVLQCQFNSPETFSGETPTTTDQEFEFSEVNCSSTQTIKKENSTTGTSFFLDQTFTYGDILIVGFLMIFLVLGIISFFINRIIPKFINFKKH